MQRAPEAAKPASEASTPRPPKAESPPASAAAESKQSKPATSDQQTKPAEKKADASGPATSTPAKPKAVQEDDGIYRLTQPKKDD